MYEITFITKEEDVKQVKKAIEDLGGKVAYDQSLGRKRFAYKIRGEEAGFYNSCGFEFDSGKLPELNKKLQLDNSVLRFLVVTKKTSQPFKPLIEKMAIAEEKPVLKKEIIEPIQEVEEKTKETKAEKPKPEIPTKTKKEAVKKTKTEKKTVKPTPSTKIKTEENKKDELGEEERLKKLEEKLDELLKE